MRIGSIPRRACRMLCIASVSGCFVSACGSSSSTSSTGASSQNGAKSGQQLVVGDIYPFTGALAQFGVTTYAGCLAAADIVNSTGGILGHKIKCQEVDDKGDPVDAVPIVDKFLATTSNLVGVVGPETDSSIGLAPVLTRAQVPWTSTTGSAYFNKNRSPYFWDYALADPENGAALAYAAHALGYRRVAVLLGTSSGSADLHSGMLTALRRLGIPPVLDLALTPGQQSYATEVGRVAAAKPDVVIGEADPPTLNTFISDLKTGGHLLPFITDATDLTPQVFDALSKSIGLKDTLTYLKSVSETPTAGGAGALPEYQRGLRAIETTYPPAKQLMTSPAAEYAYSAVIYYALAMLKVRSTEPASFNGAILSVTNPSSGATTVATYANGKAALTQGKTIRYVSLFGPLNFLANHVSTPPVALYHFQPNGNFAPVPGVTLPAMTIGSLVG
jgi:branched-chain amino acid transport system substrate-binding protein